MGPSRTWVNRFATQGNQLPEILESVYGLLASLVGAVRIPMMSISHSDLMPIRSERSDAGLSQCETVIDIRQGLCLFFSSRCVGSARLSATRVLGR
jgi:hypothetical protein